MFLRKLKKPTLCFKIEVFFLVFFFVFLLCLLFAFTLLTIIRTTKWQGTHINKASNISKTIYYNFRKNS